MAPPIVEAAAGSAAKEFKKESATARLLGSGSAGIAELAVFHPCIREQIVRRGLLRRGYQVSSASQLNKIIFKDKADAAITRKFTSLFPGLGYAAGYKVRPGLT
ncbi:MAG: hypothetical protein Q9197_003710 [Variospora fuerteventurae]